MRKINVFIYTNVIVMYALKKFAYIRINIHYIREIFDETTQLYVFGNVKFRRQIGRSNSHEI